MKRIATAILSLLLVVSTALADPDPEVVELHYDLEVASYCGLASDVVIEGFHKVLNQLIVDKNLSRNDIEESRMQAWKEAHEEWANRGLGGFKSWCRNEVSEAAERLRSFAN